MMIIIIKNRAAGRSAKNNSYNLLLLFLKSYAHQRLARSQVRGLFKPGPVFPDFFFFLRKVLGIVFSLIAGQIP